VVFEPRDAESDETKAERPFELREFFASVVELGPRFDRVVE